jgi:Ca2+-binding EF-hand superfamily protein
MLTIREIDKDHNGYVTRTELDDIMKLYYKGLANKDLFPIINKFSSISNKILIDYRAFKDYIRQHILKED